MAVQTFPNAIYVKNGKWNTTQGEMVFLYEEDGNCARYIRADGREIYAYADGRIEYAPYTRDDLPHEYQEHFTDGFSEAMPDDYCMREDLESETPWCEPWEEKDFGFYSDELTAYEAGKKYAEDIRDHWERMMREEGNRLGSDEGSTIELPHIVINLPKNRADYFCWYEGESEPQPALIIIDPEGGSMYADFQSFIGYFQPILCSQKRLFLFRIPYDLSLQKVRGIMEAIAPLADKICEGYEKDYDGDGNLIGVLNEDAQTAYEALEETIDEEISNG
ncbi:MAG: hypothetical protein IK079_04325 [Desulfovibrio sp.]|nr:hypothetical protein [Desulfovibrio sp.]